MRVSLVLIVSAVATAGAFTVPSLRKQKPASFALVRGKTALFMSESDDKDNQDKMFDFPTLSPNTLNKITASSLMTWLAASEMAGAAGPDWGIFEGRTGSILHPIMMGSLFATSLYTAFLGFQWRRQRTLGDEISSLKAKLPKIPSDYKTIQQAIDSGEMENLSELQAAIPIETEIQELTAERKSSQNNRDKHYTQGAWIAFFGTLFAIEGPLNTYARAGKLFPGPHLYAGAGLVACWAAAVVCVPYMQKGNDTARSLHIAANVSGLALFAWQVQSGLPILFKALCTLVIEW